MTESKIYTVISFAPVQSFIEKSRKLRDLYGSSFLLSYLSWIICETAKAQGFQVVSPALINVIQGTPNQIIIEGNFSEQDAKKALDIGWRCVVETCQEWIETTLGNKWDFNSWKRVWSLWKNHSWEFFYVQGEGTITNIRQLLNSKKHERDWIGINWQGESSTLSGADAVAFPGMDKIANPCEYNYQLQKIEITKFYEQLQKRLGESFIDTSEELSLPELIKRIITYEEISNNLIAKVKQYLQYTGIDFKELSENIQQLAIDLNPTTFKELNRHENKSWTGWFMGDGDKAGDYLRSKLNPDDIHKFSEEMRAWGKHFQDNSCENSFENCRIIYAGGDDFLGVFYDAVEDKKLSPFHCIQQFINFKSNIWDKPDKKPISASVGFVWAGSGVPQRDILQHCRLAEKSAKSNGRDRIALRILFNNGNYIEWVCPWHLLTILDLGNYQDRNGNTTKPNWTHIYNDVAVLESRHAFTQDSMNIALGLIEIYFPNTLAIIKDEKNWWNSEEEIKEYKRLKGGILGDRSNYTLDNTPTGELDQTKINKYINNWVINLAKVGFHLCH